ncbi:MAG: high-potential iron-sulfur protein [Woeseiaceae bacterium]|nr:high-potential iron-sulfur protein [Woeseiaceae bacterium]
MSDDTKELRNRRDFMKAVGQSAALVPILGIAACGKEAPPPAADAPPEAAAPTSPPVEEPPEPAGPVRLSLDDPQAQSLAYTHDASTVDASAQPRFEVGQACSNCVLYQGADGDEWGPCSIFPGREVNAAGWCNVYAPKPG